MVAHAGSARSWTPADPLRARKYSVSSCLCCRGAPASAPRCCAIRAPSSAAPSPPSPRPPPFASAREGVAVGCDAQPEDDEPLRSAQSAAHAAVAAPSLATSANPGAVPTSLRLLPAVPNPFNPRTTISWDQASPGPVTVDVYDLAGRHIASLVDGQRRVGRHAVTWDGRNSAGRAQAAGTYMISVRHVDERKVRKVVLVR